MKRVAFAFLSTAFFSGGAYADPGAGLPAEGAVLSANPVASGYQVAIPIGADGHYKDITVASGDAALAGILHPHVAQTTEPGGLVRVLDIDISKPLPPQGQYAATLTATPENGAKLERSVQIHIAPTAIETPPALTIVRTIWLPGRVSVSANGLEIWPSQAVRDRGWLSSLLLKQRNNLDVVPASGQVIFPGTSSVAPGEIKRFEYSDRPVGGEFGLRGKFPLGVTHATIAVMADQLAAPISVPVEIRSTLTHAYLVGMLFAGLILGWLVRQRLKRFQDVNIRRKVALAVMDVIDADILSRKDKTYVVAALAAKQKIQAALSDDDAEKLQAAIDAAQGDLTKASADYDARHGALNAQIASLDSVLGQQWRVPKQVLDKLVSDRAKLGAIKALPDLDDASTQLKELLADLAGTTAASASRLYQTAKNLAGDADRLRALAGEQASAAFAVALNSSADAINAAETQLKADPSAPLALVTELLKALNAGSVNIGDALLGLDRAIRLAAIDWSDRAAGKPLNDSPGWKAALSALEDVRQNLQQAANDAQNLPDIAARLSAVRAKIEDAIRGQAPGDDAVSQALTDGLYAKAIDALAAAKSAFVSMGSNPQKITSRLADSASRPEALVSGTSGKKAPPSPVVYASATTSPVLTPQAWKGLVDQNLAVASFLQTAIYGGIILVSGFFVFETAWVGTLQDFFAAFAWAFVIDIGADSATKALQSASRK